MSSYQEYQTKIAELQALAENARKKEISQAKEQITKIMQEYKLTLVDLSPSGRSKENKPRAEVPVKYRDNATGQTWTGRGRAPKWLEGKNREDFAVKQG